MELNKINTSGTWGKAADDLNQNFSKVNNSVEQVKNATTRNKGYFSNSSDLVSMYPTASVNDIAYVDDGGTDYLIYQYNGSAWADTGKRGGEGVVELGNYYDKLDVDNKLKATDEKLSELGSKVALNTILFNKNNQPVTLSDITDNNGIYIDYAGRTSTNAAYGITDYQYVRGLKTIRYNGRINDVKVVAYVVFFNEKKQFLSSLLTDTTEQISIDVEVPGNAYYARFSCHKTASKFSVEIPVDLSGQILASINKTQDELASYAAQSVKLTDLESQIPLNGIITKGAIISNIQRDAILRQHYINGSSIVKYENEAFLSDYVGVVADDTYEYFGHSQAAATISFFDADKKYISKVNPDVYQQIFSFITPINCQYIRYGTLSPNLPCYVRYMGDNWYKNPTFGESFKNELGESKVVGLSQQIASMLYRTICSTLYDRDNTIIEDISKVDVDKGSYLQSNGNTSSGAPYYGTTHYYLVVGLSKIHYSGFLIPNKVATSAVCFYDKNKNFISSVYTIISDSSDVVNGKYNTELTELDIDVPSNAMFARSCSYQKPLKITTSSNEILNNIAFEQLIRYIDNAKLNVAKNVIGGSDNEVYNKTISNAIALNSGLLQEVEIGAVNEGYYIVRDSGKKVPLDTGRYSNPIPVKKGDYIVFVAIGAQSGETPMIATISLTDAAGTFYKPMTIKGSESLSNVYSQCYIEEDGYIALSWISFSQYLTLYKSSSDVLNQIFKEIDELRHNTDEIKFENIDYISKYGFTYFFDKCICIGDSVTHGHIYDYPRTPANGKVIPSKAYPAYLAKMTGWEVINAGKAGITPKGWWTTMFPNYTYTDYDLAIIELGYNQGLTNTLDVDVEPYVGYENYAETNTGCYCKIIEAIKEANPNILIVLVISSNFNDTDEGVVRKIADRYELPLIDLKDKTYINLSDSKYHGYIGENTGKDYVHFNFIGYLAKAKFIFNALNYIIDYNAAMINDLHPNVVE